MNVLLGFSIVLLVFVNLAFSSALDRYMALSHTDILGQPIVLLYKRLQLYQGLNLCWCVLRVFGGTRATVAMFHSPITCWIECGMQSVNYLTVASKALAYFLWFTSRARLFLVSKWSIMSFNNGRLLYQGNKYHIQSSWLEQTWLDIHSFDV